MITDGEDVLGERCQEAHPSHRTGELKRRVVVGEWWHCSAANPLRGGGIEDGQVPAGIRRKLNFYVALVDDVLRCEHHNETSGILSCGTKNDRSVRYSLGRSTSPMAVRLHLRQTSRSRTTGTPPPCCPRYTRFFDLPLEVTTPTEAVRMQLGTFQNA